MTLSIAAAFEPLMADTKQRKFSSSRSPEKPTSQSSRGRVNNHHPMSIANLASPNPIRVENQPSIPSLPTPTASPIPPVSSRESEAGPSQNRPSQRSDDVNMEDETDVVEDEDMGDTTERAEGEDVDDEEVGEVDEDGEADEDDEDSEDDDEDEESEDDEDDEDDVRSSEHSSEGNLGRLLTRDRRLMSLV